MSNHKEIEEGQTCVTFQDEWRVGENDHPDCACEYELAKMNAEETEDTDSGYASSQEKDTWTPNDVDTTSTIILSADNLDMD
ncbi:hypothetical protein DPMN_138132 [Dreissena polymorpha]|uniref:Uncharacterized protein n=1 Tax=Dreissena polymorpha TaxID=45954 RepID=A0A9D4G378_DREPO|nr:hypothetical protein DPMN_138132 [Dreissena polymorpha]